MPDPAPPTPGVHGRSSWSGARRIDFQHLMASRVENIILVSSTYDTFILQEDGQLSELMLGEFLDLNLHHTTGLTPRSHGRRGHSPRDDESRGST